MPANTRIAQIDRAYVVIGFVGLVVTGPAFVVGSDDAQATLADGLRTRIAGVRTTFDALVVRHLHANAHHARPLHAEAGFLAACHPLVARRMLAIFAHAHVVRADVPVLRAWARARIELAHVALAGIVRAFFIVLTDDVLEFTLSVHTSTDHALHRLIVAAGVNAIATHALVDRAVAAVVAGNRRVRTPGARPAAVVRTRIAVAARLRLAAAARIWIANVVIRVAALVLYRAGVAVIAATDTARDA